MNPRIGIVGYKMGNVTSLVHAFEALSADVFVADKPSMLNDATHLVLPGVGAFPMAMDHLADFGFRMVLDHLVLEEKRPLLGICLGMQLLASSGEEHRPCAGLGYIPGRVSLLETDGLRVPHIGWNDTVATTQDILLDIKDKSSCFYYVHSFHLTPEDPAHISMTCEYGRRFAAGVQRGHIFGVQFHPEKSHGAGLAVLKRFMEVGPHAETATHSLPVLAERPDRP